MPPRSKSCILFDWGDTLMRDFKEFQGPMKDWPRLEVVPGAADALGLLYPRFTLALATSADVSDETDIRAALQRVDLERWLDRIYCFRKIGYKKPSREFYQYILDDLQLPPRSICMVGDHYQADVLAANACGMRAVWFNERSREEHENDLQRTVHSLSQLPDCLQGWLEPLDL